jgi:hypothetical protein
MKIPLGSPQGRFPMRIYYLVLAAAVILSSCAGIPTKQNPQLTIYTNPGYAMVYQDGTNLSGIAPVSLTYALTPENLAVQCVTVNHFTVVWPSGARTRTDAQLCGQLSSYQLVIERPENAPGLDGDIHHATIMQLEEQYRKAANQAALGAGLGALVGASMGGTGGARRNRPTQCEPDYGTDRGFGSTYTCY